MFKKKKIVQETQSTLLKPRNTCQERQPFAGASEIFLQEIKLHVFDAPLSKQ